MRKFYELKQDYLKFEGNERLDLINRLSTNDVKTLQDFDLVTTILTSDKARFIDLITMYNFPDFVFTTCSFNNSKSVINHLNKYTIMDDFIVNDMSGSHKSALLFGFHNPDEFEKDKFFIRQIGGFNVILAEYNMVPIVKNTQQSEKQSEMISMIIFPIEAETQINNIIYSDNKRMNDEEFEEFRITNMIPKLGNEMTELTNPLECNLQKFISFTKGCYIGQEVIARQDTYDKVSKHLIKYVAEGKIDIPAKIISEGKECGYATSIINSSDKKNIGLGFIKTIFISDDMDIRIRNEENEVKAKLIKHI